MKKRFYIGFCIYSDLFIKPSFKKIKLKTRNFKEYRFLFLWFKFYFVISDKF